jgi:hypothetical protein
MQYLLHGQKGIGVDLRDITKKVESRSRIAYMMFYKKTALAD